METKKDETLKAIASDVIAENPYASNWDIAKKASDLNVYGSAQAAYTRMSRSMYHKAHLAEIRAYHQNIIERDLTPLALKVTKKALKDKNNTDRVKFPYVKMVLDKSISDKIEQTAGIKIDQIQAIIRNNYFNNGKA